MQLQCAGQYLSSQISTMLLLAGTYVQNSLSYTVEFLKWYRIYPFGINLYPCHTAANFKAHWTHWGLAIAFVLFSLPYPPLTNISHHSKVRKIYKKDQSWQYSMSSELSRHQLKRDSLMSIAISSAPGSSLSHMLKKEKTWNNQKISRILYNELPTKLPKLQNKFSFYFLVLIMAQLILWCEQAEATFAMPHVPEFSPIFVCLVLLSDERGSKKLLPALQW